VRPADSGERDQAAVLESAEESIPLGLLPPHLGEEGLLSNPVAELARQRIRRDDLPIRRQLTHVHG